jgi:hypothetical protein
MDTFELAPLPADFAATVASLHRIAETLVAPARKPDNEIALEAAPGGFGTPEFEFADARQRVRVEAAELVREVDGAERRAPLGSLAEAGAIVADLLPAGVELDDSPLAVDPLASLALGAFYEFGADLLAELVATAGPAADATPPRLWPEHFDIAIELGSEAAGARANYGLSPGDENHAEPYLYVGPWTAAVSGELWRADGFSGAELGYAELLAASDRRAAALEFFTTRRDALNEGSEG